MSTQIMNFTDKPVQNGSIKLIGLGSPQHLILHDIPKDLFARYKVLVERLNERNEFDETLKIVKANCSEVEGLISQLTRLRQVQLTHKEFSDYKFTLNRLAANFVWSFVMSIEHIEHHLAKTFPGEEERPRNYKSLQRERRKQYDSEEFNTFSEATSNEYDSTFAFRFCSKLRNYLHVGLPFDGEGTFEETQDKEGFKGKIRFNAFSLRGKFADGWASVDKDLKDIILNEGGFFEASNVFNEAYESLVRLSKVLSSIETPHLLGDGVELKQIVQTVLDMNRAPAIAEFVQTEKDGYNMKLHHAPLESLEKLGLIKINYVN